MDKESLRIHREAASPDRYEHLAGPTQTEDGLLVGVYKALQNREIKLVVTGPQEKIDATGVSVYDEGDLEALGRPHGVEAGARALLRLAAGCTIHDFQSGKPRVGRDEIRAAKQQSA